MTNKLFIGGLSFDVTDAQLMSHFSPAGKVVSAKAIIDRNTGKCKGFGFVEMSTDKEAQKAIDDLNNTVLDGRNIVVKEAKPQTETNAIVYPTHDRF